MPSIIISSPGAVSITSYKIITFLFESTSVIFFAKPNDINKGIDYINRFTGYKEGIEKNGIHAIHLEYQPQPKIVNMSLYNENFDYIKNGTKRIEIRLNDEKRKTICVGDYIEFENLDTKEKLMVRVVALLNYGRKHYKFDFSSILATPSRFKEPGAVRAEHNVYTLDEFNQFLSVEDDLRFLCLWKTLYYCGLRIGEARGLQWKNIDWDAKSIWIKKQVQSIDNYAGNWFVCDLKTKSSFRHLHLCNTLYNDVKEYHKVVTQFKNYTNDFLIFGSQYGITPMSHSQAQRRKSNNSKKADIKEIRLHDFRHPCASLLIHNNVPLPEVSRYLGHASLTETLNTYSHMFKSDFMNISNSINQIVND